MNQHILSSTGVGIFYVHSWLRTMSVVRNLGWTGKSPSSASMTMWGQKGEIFVWKFPRPSACDTGTPCNHGETTGGTPARVGIICVNTWPGSTEIVHNLRLTWEIATYASGPWLLYSRCQQTKRTRNCLVLITTVWHEGDLCIQLHHAWWDTH